MGSRPCLLPASAWNRRPAAGVQFACKLVGSTMEETR